MARTRLRSFAQALFALFLASPIFAGSPSTPWPFEENAGRFDPAVAYTAHTPTSDVWITRDGKVVHTLRGRDGAWSIVESAGATRVVPGRASQVPVHVFHAKSAGRIGTFDTLRFPIADGVTSEIRIRDGGLERLFEIAPGADARAARVAFDGTKGLQLRPDGGLRVVTGIGELQLSAPVAWQTRGAQRLPVPVAYRVDGNAYSFALGAHDARLPVIIDPLLQSTYVGDTGSEIVWAMEAGTDRIYVAAGSTGGFPGTAGGAIPTAPGGGLDVVVASFSLDLKTMLAATYFGGTDEETARSIRVTPAAIFIGGETNSGDLPGTAGAAVTGFGGNGQSDGFIARLSPDLATLVRTTYIGGTLRDVVEGLAVNGSDLYACGFAQSSTLQGTAGAAQTSLQGTSDVFVARFSDDLTTLHRTTFLGGTEDEITFSRPAITADSVYVAGTTNSHDFPNVAGGAQPNLQASDLSDAGFVSRLSLDLSTITQSTYYATEFSQDRLTDVMFAFGDIFIYGQTAGADIPGAGGGAVAHNNLIDAFVARLNPALTSVVNATYFGGFNDETAAPNGMVVANGNLFITGATSSPTLPGTTGAIQSGKVSAADSTTDAFVASFTPDLGTLNQATFFGDQIHEGANAITASGGVIYIAGSEDSTGLPGAAGGADDTFGDNNNYDGFIAAMTTDLLTNTPPPTVSISDVSMYEGNAGTTLFNFTVTISAAPTSDAQVTVSSANGTAVAPGDFAALPPTVLTFTPFGALSQTVTISVVGDPDVEPNEQFTVNLTNASGVNIADGVGIGTIRNDDASGPAIAIPTVGGAALLVIAGLLAMLGAMALRS